jgi:nitrate/nitrite transport system substrate-binding protein
MQETAPETMKHRPLSAHALKAVIDDNQKAGAKPLTFAMVFPYSTHNYELRYWMAAAGIDPDRDVRLVVVPPPQMVGQLEKGAIDGYCVGEPWNAQAVQDGLGHTLITKYEIWNNSPEKVLGVTLEWAEQYPNTHCALLMALLEASRWLDEPHNRIEAASLIARPVYVNAPEHIVRMSMTGTFQYADTEMPRALPDFNVFHRYAANFPWRSHAVWFLSQMVRWAQVDEAFNLHTVAEAVYRPELYRRAAAGLGLLSPSVDYKWEGGHEAAWKLHDGGNTLLMGPDRFLDERKFDPSQPLAYLYGFDIHHMNIPVEDLAALNPEQSSGNQVRPSA